jgi:hypothetical protein
MAVPEVSVGDQVSEQGKLENLPRHHPFALYFRARSEGPIAWGNSLH